MTRFLGLEMAVNCDERPAGKNLALKAFYSRTRVRGNYIPILIPRAIKT
jgi:hypothetical protein